MSRPSFFEHLHPPTIPARESRLAYTFGLGGMSLFLFLTLIVSGVPLMFVYVPTSASAAASIRTITFVAPYGWLLRNLHYWAAGLLLLTGGLHLLRVVFSSSYKQPRQFNWLLGLTILLLSLLLSFSGYVLRWDVDTYGALTVGTRLVQQVPVIGHWLYQLLVGGVEISDTTLVRFYTWHTLGLVVPVSLLIGWHAFRVRRDGGISHRAQVDAASGKAPRISRRELVQREGMAALALLCLLVFLSLFWNAPLALPVNPLAGPLSRTDTHHRALVFPVDSGAFAHLAALAGRHSHSPGRRPGSGAAALGARPARGGNSRLVSSIRSLGANRGRRPHDGDRSS